MCLQFKIIQQSCSTKTWLHKMGLFNSQTWIKFWGHKEKKKRRGGGDNMCHVYILQIQWLNDPPTNLTISWSLSKQKSYSPPINVSLAFMRTCVQVQGWEAKVSAGSWKSGGVLCQSGMVSKAPNQRLLVHFLGGPGERRPDSEASGLCAVALPVLSHTGYGPRKMLRPSPLTFNFIASCFPPSSSPWLVFFLTGKLDLCLQFGFWDANPSPWIDCPIPEQLPLSGTHDFESLWSEETVPVRSVWRVPSSGH